MSFSVFVWQQTLIVFSFLPELSMNLTEGREVKRACKCNSSNSLWFISAAVQCLFLQGRSVGGKGKSRQNWKCKQNKRGFCFLKFAFPRAAWIKTWRGRVYFLLWHVYEMQKKQTNKTTKKKCQPENIQKVKNQDISLSLWLPLSCCVYHILFMRK